jgi:hypothetical protein
MLSSEKYFKNGGMEPGRYHSRRRANFKDGSMEPGRYPSRRRNNVARFDSTEDGMEKSDLAESLSTDT